MFFGKMRHLMLNECKLILQNDILEAKDSIKLAKSSLIEIFEHEHPLDVRLEEIELDDSDKWTITLSYYQDPMKSTTRTGLMAIAAVMDSNTRHYKVITIDKKTGKIESIKIRKNG